MRPGSTSPADLDPDADVTVAVLGSLGEAGVAQGVLAGAGVASRLADAATIGLAWHLGQALGGIKLQVSGRDAATAAALLLPPAAPAHPPAAGDRDRTARRALAAALFGLGVAPVVAHLYALALLARVGGQPGTLSRTGRLHALVAAVVSGLVVAVAAALVLLVASRY